jgi:hypothetical protein
MLVNEGETRERNFGFFELKTRKVGTGDQSHYHFSLTHSSLHCQRLKQSFRLYCMIIIHGRICFEHKGET